MSKLSLIEIDRKHISPSFQKRPLLQDVSIDWEHITANDICNLTRACNPWNKGAIAFFKKQEIKLIDARISGNCIEPAGSIISIDDKLKIACSDGKSIEVSMLYYMDSYQPSYNFKQLYGSVGEIFN